jgi:hypothetical protein
MMMLFLPLFCIISDIIKKAMPKKLFQMYDTDVWGFHSSRTNLGLFTSIEKALKSLFEGDFERLLCIFKKENRLFIEQISINEKEGYSQVFDSENDSSLNKLKKIIFFESLENSRNDLGFIDVDVSELFFSVDDVKSADDVTDDMIREFLNENNAVHFITQSFIQ